MLSPTMAAIQLAWDNDTVIISISVMNKTESHQARKGKIGYWQRQNNTLVFGGVGLWH